jgi:hypothetical protein
MANNLYPNANPMPVLPPYGYYPGIPHHHPSGMDHDLGRSDGMYDESGLWKKYIKNNEMEEMSIIDNKMKPRWAKT